VEREARAARGNGPPGPSLPSLLARAPAAARNPARFLEGTARRYGDVVRLGPGPYLLSRPDLVEHVLEDDGSGFEKGRVPKRLLGKGLLASDGEAHHRHRAAIEPLFGSPAVEACLEGLPEIVDRRTARWPAGETLDIQEEMAGLNSESATRVLFGLDPDSPRARRLAAELETATGPDARLSLLPVPVVARLPVASNRRFDRALAGLDESILGLIAERRRSPERGDDLLSRVAAARPPGSEDGLPDRQVRDEIVNLFSGRKSVAQAVAWTWHLLALHPDAQTVLHDEVASEIGEELPAAKHLGRLARTRAVLAESLRLYPPIWVLVRRAGRDHELDGLHIPRGATVLVSQYVLHRDPRYWSDPGSFHPDRWIPTPAARPRYAYFPFGGGMRRCVGEPLAWAEGMLALATVARRWRLDPAPGHRVRPVARVSLRAGTGIRLVARPR
jgi:cytochrome P450